MPNERTQRCTIVVSFIFIAFLGVKLKNLKCFRGDAGSMKWAILGGFLGHNFPKYGRILLKFLPEVVLKNTKSVFEESL